MGVIVLTDRKAFTNKQFGKALELYYHKGYDKKVQVGEFLNHVFKLNDPKLKRMDTYVDGLQYFKSTYVMD
jgi:hypothetical protein